MFRTRFQKHRAEYRGFTICKKCMLINMTFQDPTIFNGRDAPACPRCGTITNVVMGGMPSDLEKRSDDFFNDPTSLDESLEKVKHEDKGIEKVKKWDI